MSEEPVSLRYDLERLDTATAIYAHQSLGDGLVRCVEIERAYAYQEGRILNCVWVCLDEAPPMMVQR
jgi:uncharacterized protein (DUF1810 family)